MIATSSPGVSPRGGDACHAALCPRDKLKKHSKSAIQLELDVNGATDEEFLQLGETDHYQPARTPSVLCNQTHFQLENWNDETIIRIIHDVLSRCEEISYEYIEADFKFNALYLECSHHCKFEIRIYKDHEMVFTVDMNRHSGEGKCFNKLFGTFKETLLNKTSVEAIDISVAAQNRTIHICDGERDTCPIGETEVVCALKTIKDMAICNKYEAQCETSRMLCMLSKRVEIHPYISRFGIVTVLVKELLNTRYCVWTRQHAMLALAGLSETEICRDSMIAAGILPLLITLAVDSPYDTAEMSRKAAKTLSNLTATPESAAAVIKELSPKVVVMWMNSVSQCRDRILKMHADQATQHLCEAFSRMNIKCKLTSRPVDASRLNKGNRCSPGVVTSLMLAAQAHSSHIYMLSRSHSHNEIPMVFSSNTTLLVSAAVSSNLSPTSVSSSSSSCSSNFVYPAVSGRCQFVNDFIIDRLTSVLAYSPDGSTALMYAAQAGNLEAVTFLVESGSNIEQQRKDGRTALQIAASAGRKCVVAYLIAIGAFFSVDKKGMNALHLAVENGHIEIVAMLLDAQAELVHSRRHDGMTGLLIAKFLGDSYFGMITFLIDRGAEDETSIDNGADVRRNELQSNW